MIPMLLAAGMALGAWQATPPTDTVVLAPDEAFSRALATAPSLEASRRRTAASEALLRQAGAWQNPTLSVAAENVGATRSISGVSGMAGVEGQIVVTGLVPIGGDRGAAVSAAGARLREARSLQAGTEADLRSAVVAGLASAARDAERLRRAMEEAGGLEALASALAAQSEMGRASAGEAARAHLAMVSAYAAAAEVAAEAAASKEQLALLLGLEPGTPVALTLPICDAPSSLDEVPGEAPEILAAAARGDAARAQVARQRAARVPDVMPQVGVRRAAGVSALYLGLSFELPFFDRRGGAVEGALASEAAAAAELDRVEKAVAARRESLAQGLVALEEAGSRFTPEWAEALDQAVVAAEARYRLGEGTLTELLDGRKARLQALDGYERWRARLFTQRAQLARLTDHPIDASMLCGASLPPNTHAPEERP